MAIYEITEKDGAFLRRFRGGDLDHFLGSETVAVLRGDRDWQEWIHPEDRVRIDEQLGRGGDITTIEYRWIGPEGVRHHILDQLVQTSTGSGPKRWAGSLLDITERKELEARLVHAGKLDALGQLTGGVAHDFNNLLAAMLGGLSILQRRLKLGEREQLVVDQMRHAATQGSELVRRMMAFGRQQELVPEIVEPATLCDSVAGLVSHALGGAVSVAWQCPGAGLNFLVDRGQLELALMNLIINSRDAMPEGGEIKVTIEAVAENEKGQPMLRIRVSDTGSGIPEDVLARVTEPFFTTKEPGKGTGLGLSMVSGFAHQSGGEMRIDSTVGKGTSIALILPATEAKPLAKRSDGQEALEWLIDKRLMIIDDDDAVRTVLSEQFRDAGAIIEDFASGDEAIAAIEKTRRKYDYILSDFAMPGLDGLATLERMGTLAPGARTVLMTGNADDARLAKAKRVPVIRKPLNGDF
jgi:signal transduction histidine kinase